MCVLHGTQNVTTNAKMVALWHPATSVSLAVGMSCIACWACPAGSAPQRRDTGTSVSYVGLNAAGLGCCRFSGGMNDVGVGFKHVPHVMNGDACAVLCTADVECKGFEASSWGGCELHLRVPVYATTTAGCMCMKKLDKQLPAKESAGIILPAVASAATTNSVEPETTGAPEDREENLLNHITASGEMVCRTTDKNGASLALPLSCPKHATLLLWVIRVCFASLDVSSRTRAAQ